MTRKYLRNRIRKVLERHSGKCLDNAHEFRAIVAALVRGVFENRCDRCDHLDEVHGTGGCLGGPIADCNCTGFKEES